MCRRMGPFDTTAAGGCLRRNQWGECDVPAGALRLGNAAATTARRCFSRAASASNSSRDQIRLSPSRSCHTSMASGRSAPSSTSAHASTAATTRPAAAWDRRSSRSVHSCRRRYPSAARELRPRCRARTCPYRPMARALGNQSAGASAARPSHSWKRASSSSAPRASDRPGRPSLLPIDRAEDVCQRMAGSRPSAK